MLNLENVTISRSVLSSVSYSIAIEEGILPFSIDEKGILTLLISEMHNMEKVQRIQMLIGKRVKLKFLERDTLFPLIVKQYDLQDNGEGSSVKEKHVGPVFSLNPREAIITMVTDILWEAIRRRASDIHFEPFEEAMQVRFRIDGVLQNIVTVPSARVSELVSRIKIMAHMDIAEKRRAQDGKIRFAEQGRDMDIRVSTLPTGFGEKVVLRLLDTKSFNFSLESIGMSPDEQELFRRAIEQPNGIVLITGPTGSGKSTTLYGAVNHLKKPGINISTVEDPIEYNMPGINQSQVKPEIDMTFANLLRTLLRQDPNVIMVGEMRDKETAEIAIRASLTGHLVLSTLHTNDSLSAITRLIDIGIDSYLVSSSLTMVVAQRLVRRVCSHCSCVQAKTEELRERIGFDTETPLYRGVGCSHCNQTGYSGRVGLFEILPISEELRSMISKNESIVEMRAFMKGMPFRTLKDSAFEALRSGTTSIEEIAREVAVLA